MKYIITTLVFIAFVNNGNSQVDKVDAIGITVSDMDRSVAFYSEVLHFQKISDTEVYGSQWEELTGIFGVRMHIVRMQLGNEFIELTDYLTAGGRSIPETIKSNDLSFQHLAIVVSNMDSAYRQLRVHNVQHVSTGPQTLPASIPEASGIQAFYFQDPDKHVLEIIHFPVGKGQDKWQAKNGQLFLGIDHTAIGISNTQQSHRFYQLDLGITRKGDSWNKGVEQEHLNNIKGASLHITGYRSQHGPGIEFLEYLKPGPGKKYPADSRVDDIWNWYTILEVDNAEKVFRLFKGLHVQFVSNKIVVINDDETPTYKAFLIRDPDGHALLIKENLLPNKLATK